MPHLSPTTLTTDEQRVVLRATAGNVRDNTIISLALALALGTGLRLAEIVGLDWETCVPQAPRGQILASSPKYS